MRRLIGKGRIVHDKIMNALFSWELLKVGSLRLFPTTPHVAPEAVVAILSSHFGILSVDFCRVIYVMQGERERNGAIFRTGFAYGTLSGHAVRGEELFSIEWHPATEEVWYDIFSFSRPATSIVRLVGPFARAAQRRFALASLQKAIQIGRSVSTQA